MHPQHIPDPLGPNSKASNAQRPKRISLSTATKLPQDLVLLTYQSSGQLKPDQPKICHAKQPSPAPLSAPTQIERLPESQNFQRMQPTSATRKKEIPPSNFPSKPDPPDLFQLKSDTRFSNGISPNCHQTPSQRQEKIDANKDRQEKNFAKTTKSLPCPHQQLRRSPKTVDFLKNTLTPKFCKQSKRFRLTSQHNYYLTVHNTMSSNRYAENRAFASPGFSNVARPFSSPRSPTDVRPNPAVMSEIVADHLELYCLQAARASKTPPYIFFQGIGIDDDDAFTQLEYFQQIVHLPILIPFPADYDFEGNARAVGHRNSTQKRLNLVLSVLEPKTFATDWALTDSSTPEEILHPYMSASCLTRKVREGDGGRLIAVSREVSAQDSLIPPEQFHQWQPAGYFSGLDPTLNSCLGSLKVAVKATCISLLLADGKENLARLAESYLDFTWRHISFRLDSKQYTINLGELYYCEDPALIDDPQATEFTRVIAPLLSHLFLSSDRTKNHAVVNIHGARLCFSSPNIKLPTPSPGHIKRLVSISDSRKLFPLAFDGLRPGTPLILLVCRWYQLGLPPHSVVRAFHGTIDRPTEPTRLKDRWLHQPKPILWFHTLESAMAIVKRINIFAPMFSDYWDSDLVPMSVRPLFVVPPRHEMLPHFAPLPRDTRKIKMTDIHLRWAGVTDQQVAKQLSLPEGTRVPRKPLFPPQAQSTPARSTSPGKRQHVNTPATPSGSSLVNPNLVDPTDTQLTDDKLEGAISSLLRTRILRDPAFGIQFAEQLLANLKQEVRSSHRYIPPDSSQLNQPHDFTQHLSGLSDFGEDSIPPGFYGPLAPPNDDEDMCGASDTDRDPNGDDEAHPPIDDADI